MVCGRCGRKRLGNPLNLFADLEDFLHDHRAHGRLTADATEPAWNGYLLTVACRYGVVGRRRPIFLVRARSQAKQAEWPG